jgi:hypothetical protein
MARLGFMSSPEAVGPIVIGNLRRSDDDAAEGSLCHEPDTISF